MHLFGVFGPFIYDTDEGCQETFSLSKIKRSFLSTNGNKIHCYCLP